MSWSPSPRPLAVPLVLALTALAVALYVTCRPGLQAVGSVLRQEPANLGLGEGPFWHREPSYVATDFGRSGWRCRDFVPLRPCEARNVFSARTCQEGESGPVVLNAVIDGRVMLRGYEYPLPDDRERNEATRREGRFGVRALELTLDELATYEPAPAGILLNADCGVPWRHMRTLLQLIPNRPWARDALGWVVARPPHGTGLELRSILGSLASDRASTGELPLAVAQTDGGGGEVRLPDQTFRFPPRALPSDRTPAADLEVCNRLWAEVERRLGAVPSAQRAVLRTGADASSVPLAYVITLFDLLIGRRILAVELPDEGLELQLVAPAGSLEEQQPPPPEPEAVIPGWVGLLTVLGMVAAFHVAARRTA